MSERDEEGVEWCGSSNLWEEEILLEVSRWVRKGSELNSTQHCDSIEEPGGEETQGSHESSDT